MVTESAAAEDTPRTHLLAQRSHRARSGIDGEDVGRLLGQRISTENARRRSPGPDLDIAERTLTSRTTRSVRIEIRTSPWFPRRRERQRGRTWGDTPEREEAVAPCRHSDRAPRRRASSTTLDVIASIVEYPDSPSARA